MKQEYYFTWNEIKFLNKKNISFEEDILSTKFITVPSAPVLLEGHANYLLYKALKSSDFSIIDSSLFAILCRLHFRPIYKFSGYLLVNSLLKYLHIKRIKVLLVDPTEEIGKLNRIFLLSNTQLVEEDIINYTAPFFRKNDIIEDEVLLRKILITKPRIVLLGIGGGKQEILANYLKKNIPFEITILCTGAALSFFTGVQAPIDKKIDKLYLGWLFRILDNPKVFLPRYLNSLKFIFVFFRHKIKF